MALNKHGIRILKGVAGSSKFGTPRRNLDVNRIDVFNKSRSCAYCGQGLTYKEMTVDHIVPLSKGGLNRIENLTAACFSCNQAKGNKLVATG